ncbi:MAG: hypothetical protein ACI976_003130 [Aureispira sp.]|jgi:hypothetical protein
MAYYKSPTKLGDYKCPTSCKCPIQLGVGCGKIVKQPINTLQECKLSQQALTDCIIWEASYDNLTKLSFEYPKLNV